MIFFHVLYSLIFYFHTCRLDCRLSLPCVYTLEAQVYFLPTTTQAALVFHGSDLSIQFYFLFYILESTLKYIFNSKREEKKWLQSCVCHDSEAERENEKTYKFIIYRYLRLFTDKSTLEAILMLFRWTVFSSPLITSLEDCSLLRLTWRIQQYNYVFSSLKVSSINTFDSE